MVDVVISRDIWEELAKNAVKEEFQKRFGKKIKEWEAKHRQDFFEAAKRSKLDQVILRLFGGLLKRQIIRVVWNDVRKRNPLYEGAEEEIKQYISEQVELFLKAMKN